MIVLWLSHCPPFVLRYVRNQAGRKCGGKFLVRDALTGNGCPDGFSGYQKNESDNFTDMLTCGYKILSVLEGRGGEADTSGSLPMIRILVIWHFPLSFPHIYTYMYFIHNLILHFLCTYVAFNAAQAYFDSSPKIACMLCGPNAQSTTLRNYLGHFDRPLVAPAHLS